LNGKNLVNEIKPDESELVEEKQQKGILFGSKNSGEWVWIEKDNGEMIWKYNGDIKNNKPNGQGISISGGVRSEGEFWLGELWYGTNYDKDGNIINKVLNGKIIEE